MELTKQQIYDLEFKWNLPSKYRVEGTEWWNDERYWKDVVFNNTLPDEFYKEYEDQAYKYKLEKSKKMFEFMTSFNRSNVYDY